LLFSSHESQTDRRHDSQKQLHDVTCTSGPSCSNGSNL
jgi:hypothetical protein